MGGRGAFINVDLGNFDFVLGGQHYHSLGTLKSDPNVKIVMQDSNNVKAPEYSHTAGRIYAIVKDGYLKHLAYYDENHKQAVSIDLLHAHKGVIPHKHNYMQHDKKSPGIPITDTERNLINKIKKEYHLK